MTLLKPQLAAGIEALRRSYAMQSEESLKCSCPKTESARMLRAAYGQIMGLFISTDTQQLVG